jgi:putative phosphoribosyl transferase
MRGEQRFADRRAAGRELAGELSAYARRENLLVLGLPRGGVPVAYEVARALGAPLDVLLARKLGVPGREELAFGALASGDVRVLNDDVVAAYAITEPTIDQVSGRAREEIARRERAYRGDRPSPDLEGRTVIVVDDGLATGSTMLAAVRVLRAAGPRHLTVAVPVGAPSVCDGLGREADEVVCLLRPEPMLAVGAWYRDFAQLEDQDVRELLQRAERESAERQTLALAEIVAGDGARLGVDLTIPPSPRALMVFAHGTGSGRTSPRNRLVAGVLQEAGIATLLMDLLTEEEERRDQSTGELRFDIGLLADRLVTASDQAMRASTLASLPLVYFGASTGAAAALVAAARQPGRVQAVVSRGGRPDLAGDALPLVKAPTLLIVGGEDRLVLELNERARRALGGVAWLEVVPGAGHLFEEPGALERVAALARDFVLEQAAGSGESTPAASSA